MRARVGFGHGGDDGYAADGAGGLAFENGEELFGLLWREQSDDVGVFGHGLEVVLACGLNFQAVDVVACG